MIEFDQVSKRYHGGHEALKNVTFRLDQGEMAFVTGHSGAGKSTMLRLMMAIEQPTAGQVRVNHRIINRMPRRQVPFFRRELGIVHQNHELLPEKTVFENIALPLQIAGMSPRDIDNRVRAALDKVGLLDKIKYYPVMLSGGEQQRIGIARAVVNKPKIILADEPTGNLDPALSRDIMDLFRQFNRVGTTVLVVSHDLGLVARMPYRVLTLKQGQLKRVPV
ncbi:cell division ATP-binding protein FtsE [Salinibius halmophilus]|uniref:cell division ATP-binding protein FtsE n=1 Tax=Salinibius halmophilus TaxID=1853216 RepID=UPI000E66778D|nr:cell division ATP-binding protein FtsE [Salinibius halmophilus]